jgi:hypothetical protein
MGAARFFCLYFSLLIFLLICCTGEQPYAPQDRPGKIVGLVKPEGIIAQVELYQGTLIQTTFSDSSGYFEMDSVSAGIYNLEIFSKNQGRQILNGVTVYPGQVTTVPDIQLRPYPEQILTFIPVNGEPSFPLTAPIQIQFSTLMDYSSVENNFFLDPSVSGRFSWEVVSGNSKLSFYPTDQYISNAYYLIKITTEAKTSSGEPLSLNFVSYFTTEGVKVTSSIPENDATFISPQTSIYVYFNSRMDLQSVEQNFSITPLKIGNFKWFDSRRVCFQPGSYLASKTLYTITIGSNAKDVFGNLLHEATTVKFETEPLRITSNYPANGATSVSRSVPITITFNTLVNQEMAQQAFALSPAIAGGEFQWSDLTRFQYAGTTMLQANTFYTVTIDTTCSDAWGNSLPSNYSFIFKTGN